MRVLGIDPSLTSTGLALVEGGRVLETRRIRSKKAGHERLDEIISGIAAGVWGVQRMHNAALRPAPPEGLIVGIEGPAMGAKGSSVVQIYGLWCLITHTLHQWGLTYYVVPPSNLKIYATGSGNAGKDEVLLSVAATYPGSGVKGNDDADALVIAAMGARHYGEPVEASLPQTRLRGLDKVQW